MIFSQLLVFHEVPFQESQKQKQHPTGKFVEEVYVPQSLLGIAIGSGGNNVGAARSIAGIISIELDDSTSTFAIVGDVSGNPRGLKMIWCLLYDSCSLSKR